ncbi:MAG: PepSY domain-containing protein [Deltaproteobacteria bacterium]|nr:PepSY domain-containing protein [Deltaproteobacteria bacterium]
MNRILSIALAVGVVTLLAGAALAQMGGGPAGGGMGAGMMGGGMGPGMMGGGTMGGGMMGPGMMGGAAGQAGAGAQPAQITEEKAKELAQQYADTYLKGFTVEKVLPFTGMHGTMYSVELKGAEGQVRTFHINPWGNVMPFGGAQRRSG